MRRSRRAPLQDEALEGPYPDEYHALLKRYYEQVYQDAQERETQ